MQILPLELLKCVETGGSALTVPELLLVLFSKFSTIYGLNKLLYCRSCEHRRKTSTAIVARSFESRMVHTCWEDRWAGTSCSTGPFTWSAPLTREQAADTAQSGCKDSPSPFTPHLTPQSHHNNFQISPSLSSFAWLFHTGAICCVYLLRVIMNLCVHITISPAVG